jgi:hypothetical protein
MMACGAVAILFGFIVMATAEGPPSIASAKRITAECAGHDLKVTAFIEEHGDADELPAGTLGKLGLMQLQARLSCLAGEETRAIAVYEHILSAARVAERVGP